MLDKEKTCLFGGLVDPFQSPKEKGCCYLLVTCGCFAGLGQAGKSDVFSPSFFFLCTIWPIVMPVSGFVKTYP
jgi:hypothetical protein